MIAIAVSLTSEQVERLDELCEVAELSRDALVGVLIDLDWEEWKEPDDAVLRDASRATRFARFVASIAGGLLVFAFAGCVAQPKHTACATDVATQRAEPSLPMCVTTDVKKAGAQ